MLLMIALPTRRQRLADGGKSERTVAAPAGSLSLSLHLAASSVGISRTKDQRGAGHLGGTAVKGS
jgi:hypothetical protein